MSYIKSTVTNSDSVPEGSTNLYWTSARFDTRFGTKNTDNLGEGVTNFYWTNARFDTRFALGGTFTGKVTTATSAAGGAGLTIPHGAAPTAPVNGDFWTTSGGGLWGQINGTTYQFVVTANGAQWTAKQTFKTPTTGAASIVLPSGVAPTSPVSGDVWNQSGVLKLYDGTATRSILMDSSTLDATKLSGNLPALNGSALTGLTASQVGISSTTNVPEGTNLYYTQTRFDSAFTAKSTTNLTEGTNLYYTQARFDSAFSGKSTTNLSEGTNLYWTNARFDTRFGASLTSGAINSALGYTAAPLATVTVYTSDPATLDTTNQIAVINKTVASATAVTLPLAPAANQQVIIKDGKGDCATNNITVSGNGKNIDGASTKVINVNYASFTLVYNGTQWNLI